jgi:hypothetical protein
LFVDLPRQRDVERDTSGGGLLPLTLTFLSAQSSLVYFNEMATFLVIPQILLEISQ